MGQERISDRHHGLDSHAGLEGMSEGRSHLRDKRGQRIVGASLADGMAREQTAKAKPQESVEFHLFSE